jgi:hypothetical protein
VDRADGPLARNGNRALRAALLTSADNLIRCHHYFKHLEPLWRAQGKDASAIRSRGEPLPSKQSKRCPATALHKSKAVSSRLTPKTVVEVAAAYGSRLARAAAGG